MRTTLPIALLLTLLEAAAQREPRIGYIYPAGGRQGTTFVATLGGTALESASNVFFSGAGVTAQLLKLERQPTPQEQDALVKELSQLRAQRERGEGLTRAEAQRAAEIRTTLDRFGRQLSNQALSQFATVRVSIATNAAPGKREVRLGTSFGLSNPLAFCVDDLPEISKPDWKNVPKSKDSMDPELTTGTNETRITLPAMLNGQLQPGGVDRYRFAARRGQQLTIIVSARELLPYLADAVPGWLQATLALYDAQGTELAYDDKYLFRPDPVLMFKIPRDGDYVLAIKDALFRGREDFVYRLALGELPFVTGIFPLGGQAGGQSTVAVSGWNLAQQQATFDLRKHVAGSAAFHVRGNGRLSNRIPFAVDNLPELFEQEPNNSRTNAQAVTLPVTINGRIGQPGDVDCFQFTGQAGARLVVEVLARRLDSPLDAYLKLADAAGQQLAFNDDHEDKASGLNTHHADAYLALTLPSNGVYCIYLGDTQHNGGAAHSYRLRISAPRPDFELRVTPSGINARGGTSVPLTVYALRKDGFAGEIALALQNAPNGFALAGARIPAGQDKVNITLAVPPQAMVMPLTLHLEGRATIAGRAVARLAVPADDLTQAFAYRHLVPAQEQKVSVWGRHPAREQARVLSATPLKIPLGGTAQLEVSWPTDPQMGKIAYELFDAPEGLALRNVAAGQGHLTITLEADAAKLKPGLAGNLIIRAFAEHSPETRGSETPANKRRVPLGALPAVPFELVPSLGK